MRVLRNMGARTLPKPRSSHASAAESGAVRPINAA
jgi:hypothetical protein